MGLGQIAEYVYTVILKPRPLRLATNALLKLILPRNITLRDTQLALNPGDPVVSGALALGVYETEEIDFFCSHLENDMTLIDVGANIGLYSCLALASDKHNGKIIAFEPHAETIDYLTANLAQNNSGQDVVLMKAAAAATNGKLELYANPENKGDNRLYPAAELHAIGSIDARTIDAVCQ
jgi:FkbM family methyltransferase